MRFLTEYFANSSLTTSVFRYQVLVKYDFVIWFYFLRIFPQFVENNFIVNKEINNIENIL